MNYCGSDKMIPNPHYMMDNRSSQPYTNIDSGLGSNISNINNMSNMPSNFTNFTPFTNGNNSNINYINSGTNDLIINNYNINKQDSFGKVYPLNSNNIPNTVYYPMFDNFSNGTNYVGNQSNYQVLSSSNVSKKNEENIKKKN